MAAFRKELAAGIGRVLINAQIAAPLSRSLRHSFVQKTLYKELTRELCTSHAGGRLRCLDWEYELWAKP
jgi:hypothetical protein